LVSFAEEETKPDKGEADDEADSEYFARKNLSSSLISEVIRKSSPHSSELSSRNATARTQRKKLGPSILWKWEW